MALKNTQGVTINTIAGHLGLSSGTVSYVLSGQAKKRKISDATALRVKQTADRLGYVPNQWARSLKNGKTGAVSLLFSDLMGGWAHRITQGITDIFQPQGYTPIISLYDRSEILTAGLGGIGKHQMDMILQRRDEGVLCHPTFAARADYIRLQRCGVPLVFIGSVFDDMAGLENVSTVTWDCKSAAETAMQHLIDIGKKRIAFFGVRHDLHSDAIRYEAYKKILNDSDLHLNDNWILWGPPYRFIKEEVVELMRPLFCRCAEKPDAIFAINDAVAIGIMEVLNSMGISVPDDVAVIGMGNLDIARHEFINLSTVREPIEEIGRCAAETFFDILSKPDQAPFHRKICCNELKMRKTTSK